MLDSSRANVSLGFQLYADEFYTPGMTLASNFEKICAYETLPDGAPDNMTNTLDFCRIRYIQIISRDNLVDSINNPVSVSAHPVDIQFRLVFPFVVDTAQDTVLAGPSGWSAVLEAGARDAPGLDASIDAARSGFRLGRGWMLIPPFAAFLGNLVLPLGDWANDLDIFLAGVENGPAWQ